MKSSILKRGYKAKLLRDRRDCVEIATCYRLSKGKYLSEEQIRELLKALREDNETGEDDVIGEWYTEHWPEARLEILETEKELQSKIENK